MDGVLIVDKPTGYTSFDIIAIVRKLLGEKKVGHTGTLDPIATGVLVVLIGKATKAQVFMSESYKEYVAEFKLGLFTDTQDITGKVIQKKDVKACREDVEKCILKFVGDIEQVPPMYSAVKKNGVRLYDMARKGIEIERPVRNVKIYGIELLNYDEKLKEGRIKVRCSKGTYIRTLCEDIGIALDCGAVMTSLRRTYTDGFSIKDSKSIDEIKLLKQDLKLSKVILCTDVLFKNLPCVSVSKAQRIRFLNGGSLMLSRVLISDCVEGQVKVYCEDEFLGLGQVNLSKNEVSVLKVLNGISGYEDIL